MNKNDTVTWTSKTFDPATDEYVNFLVNGKYIAIRFESGSNSNWAIQSFGVEYELGGRF